jgi:hypothetical protein
MRGAFLYRHPRKSRMIWSGAERRCAARSARTAPQSVVGTEMARKFNLIISIRVRRLDFDPHMSAIPPLLKESYSLS